MAGIIASDLLDGPIARRLGTASGKGGLLGALCDALVVVAAAVVLGLKDARYFSLAGLMAAAFVSWGAYSLVIGRFAHTRLGRHDGVACFALVASADAWPRFAALGIRAPVVGEWIAICAVVGVLGVSAAENVLGTWRAAATVKGLYATLACRDAVLFLHRLLFHGKSGTPVLSVVLWILFAFVSLQALSPTVLAAFAIADRGREAPPIVIGRSDSPKAVAIVCHPGASSLPKTVNTLVAESLADNGCKVTLHRVHAQLKVDPREVSAIGLSSPVYLGAIRWLSGAPAEGRHADQWLEVRVRSLR